MTPTHKSILGIGLAQRTLAAIRTDNKAATIEGSTYNGIDSITIRRCARGGLVIAMHPTEHDQAPVIRRLRPGWNERQAQNAIHNMTHAMLHNYRKQEATA